MKLTLDRRVRRWSMAIRLKSDCKCEWCGKEGHGVAHIIPRAQMKTRYVLQNGWCACNLCHTKFDNNGMFRNRVINILIGMIKYRKLTEVAYGKKTCSECGFEEVD